MKKIITFVVPCYNSEAYMEKCVTMLADAGEEVEVLVVDDGSKDNTLKIAKDLESKYPGIVKAIHQENKGHGGVINTGIASATGIYFKVIDSDDWVLTEDVIKVLNIIKNNLEQNIDIDAYFVNYVYERVYENTQKSINYKGQFPVEKVFTWEDMKPFKANQVLMMHSIIYSLDVLKRCGIVLPEHVFYEDNYFIYQPLPYLEKLYYIDNDYYHYLLGRPDQSCTDENLFKRYDNQLTVTDLVMKSYTLKQVKSFPKQLQRYMIHEARAMFFIAIVFAAGGKTNVKDRKANYKALIKLLKHRDPAFYHKVSNYVPAIVARIKPWFIRRPIARAMIKARSKFSL